MEKIKNNFVCELEQLQMKKYGQHGGQHRKKELLFRS